MKKFSILFFLTAFAITGFFTSCNNDDPAPEPTTDECAAATFPPSSGTAAITFKNFSTGPDTDEIINVNAAAGDYLSIAVEIIKGTNRPQKLRVFQTECANVKGTAVSFPGQPKTEDQDKTIDLANTNDPQLRTLLYQVPSGFGTLYLNFEVDESGSKYSYARIKLNISGSGVIDSYTGITLGGNSSSNPSRLASGTGETFTSCATAANISYIDITYGVATTSPYNSYFLSNPARFDDFTNSPMNSTATTATKADLTACGDEPASEYPVRGGNPTYFKAYTGGNFAGIDDAGLSALTVSSTDPQFIQITTAGQVFEFLTSSGRKGLIRYNSGTLNNTGTDINVDVKVQR